MVIQINNIEQLQKEALDDDCQSDALEFCFSNGIAKSTKTIRYYPDDTWEVFHYSCDEWEEWNSTKEFINCQFTGGMIYDAIEKGEFYVNRI